MTLRKCIFAMKIILNGILHKADHHWNYQQALELLLQGLVHFNQNYARTIMYHLKNRPCIES